MRTSLSVWSQTPGRLDPESSINQKIKITNKNGETRAQTPALAPSCSNYSHSHTTVWMTTHKPELYSSGRWTELVRIFLPSPVIFAILFLHSHKNEEAKDGVHFGLYFPFYLWERSRTAQMGRGEPFHSMCSSPQEWKKKRSPNPKNLN